MTNLRPHGRTAWSRDTGTTHVLTETQVQRRGVLARAVVAHPWTADVAVAATVLLAALATVLVALATVEGSVGLGLYPPDTPALRLVPGSWLVGAGAGAVALLARRAWPLAVTATLTLLAVVSLGTTGVLGVLGLCLACALHTVAATRPARTAWFVGGAVLVVVSAALWRWEDIGLAEMLLWSDAWLAELDDPVHDLTEPPFSPGRRSASVTLLLALLALGVATGSGVRARRLHARDLVERYAALARDRDASAALARAAERTRIAREMHDVVAHSVSVMVALSDGARAALDRAPDRSRDALVELSRTGRAALGDMQRVLGALDPADDGTDGTDAPGGTPRAPGPTETDLGTVVERFRAAGLPLTVTGLDTLLPEDTTLRLAVVRVVAEGLTNVLRHAPGTRSVHVTVRRTDSAVEVEVLDAGGTRPGTGGGTHRGILGMRERAALLGGHVDAGPRPEGGWRVHVVLPWRHDEGADGGDDA
ncbi:sensor histidine kinase [Cellulomonas cellasea]|uniref:histidine kinase n=1 Tax=Cellulomonas cellasea DSM 20118 TaxID=1408250 RepID=A0A0A0B9V3_9CELL|nr:histidine kinase [Cellulomonas cellasea]KGM02046.1 histidine kinase [Cellulomonas cellasea DSM 20118]